MDARVVALDFASEIDKTNVAKHDWPIVKQILADIVMFENPMPKLAIDIYDPGDDCYVVSIKGYAKAINMVRWVNKFHGSQRADHLQFCKGSKVTPSPDPALVMRIKKRDFSETQPRVGKRRGIRKGNQ